MSFWKLFFKEEFRQAINKCNNSSVSGLDKLTWHHLKSILKQDDCLNNIINITDTCINLEHWLNYFKCSSIVVIPKPNKLVYNQPKSFYSIVLLNTLGKLIEKVVAKRLQFIITKNDFIHLSQLGGLKFKFTTDTGIALTRIVWSGWVKNKTTSTLAFNIAQFFLSLNYCLLTLILEKADLNSKVVSFFIDHLIERKTNYIWNGIFSPIFGVNIGVGQGSALSPILLVLYLSHFLYILEKCLKNPISTISFMDDGLIISQNKLIDILNSHLFCSYNILTKLLDKFGLIIEHSKTEIFHFNRSYGFFNPSLLDLSTIRGPTLHPKDS